MPDQPAPCCAPARPVAGRPAAYTTELDPTPLPDPDRYAGMAELPGGAFLMGNEDRYANPQDAEGPVRKVELSALRVDTTAVTNAAFRLFADTTEHRTTAERTGWSYVFAGLLDPAVVHASPAPAATPWWRGVRGASWREPYGPGSVYEDNHPVVHVSWDDARAYAVWAGKRLPAEPEWEYAARGGLPGARYPWGDDLDHEGAWRCNIWRGEFPLVTEKEDGQVGTVPVDAYGPNGFGLYNTVGNVWEWTADPFGSGRAGRAMRGGSYLCHASYCNRYRVAARTSNTEESSSGNIGFRCVADV
ncbi:formylglycine-generating enzyme family protein [Streptomyces sp. NPDC091272]|uniref:formylglycine-generating enzyme family protein n=1 Tax=Streptomyces sp. NPDC091272 TaxID=3365981 RepID=UPI003811BC95